MICYDTHKFHKLSSYKKRFHNDTYTIFYITPFLLLENLLTNQTPTQKQFIICKIICFRLSENKLKTKEEKNEYQKKWYNLNKDKINFKRRKQRHLIKNKLKSQAKKYYELHKTEISERRKKKYHFNHPFKQRNQQGEKNFNWKGGIVYDNGYRLIFSPNHPRNNRGYVQEHILIMEKHLKKYLDYFGKGNPNNEVIHYIDENRQNNNIKNLKLMTLQEHLKLHHPYSSYKRRFHKHLVC